MSEEIIPSTIGVNTYAPADPVVINSGYNVGMYFVSTGTIPFEYGGAVSTYTSAGYGVPVVGSTIVQNGTSNRIYSFVANGFSCEQTGYFRDSINMTAALINPGNVSGTVSANGCNIGVYYTESGKVSAADIFGANYFGVMAYGINNDVNVDIFDSKIHNIGEVPFNGAQHGLAVYYATITPNSGVTTGNVTGKIKGNVVTDYQKGGVIVNGEKSDVTIENNHISTVDLSKKLATNSVQLGWQATGIVEHNYIGGNQWCGPSDYVATAILLYDANSPVIKQNNIRGNSDIGIYIYADNSVIDNNKVFDEGQDCNVGHYDYGIGNYGDDNQVTNNKVKNFDTPYDGVDGGKNKSIPGSQPGNPWF